MQIRKLQAVGEMSGDTCAKVSPGGTGSGGVYTAAANATMLLVTVIVTIRRVALASATVMRCFAMMYTLTGLYCSVLPSVKLLLRVVVLTVHTNAAIALVSSAGACTGK